MKSKKIELTQQEALHLFCSMEIFEKHLLAEKRDITFHQELDEKIKQLLHMFWR